MSYVPPPVGMTAAKVAGAPPTQVPALPAYSHTKYVMRQKVFTFMGKKFHVYDPQGQVVLFSKMKALKLKEDMRLYTGEDMQTELLTIMARKIIDFSSAYDVVDSRTREKIGALKRKGMKSILRDEWIIMDAQEREIGLIQEDSTALAIIRRFVDFANMILPQKYTLTIGGNLVGVFAQNFNPFVRKLSLDFTLDGRGLLDRRLGLAAAVVLMAIEGRQ